MTFCTFLEVSAANAMSRGTQELVDDFVSFLSLDTSAATRLLVDVSRAPRGMTARHSPLAMSSEATTPISAHEPSRPI